MIKSWNDTKNKEDIIKKINKTGLKPQHFKMHEKLIQLHQDLINIFLSNCEMTPAYKYLRFQCQPLFKDFNTVPIYKYAINKAFKNFQMKQKACSCNPVDERLDKFIKENENKATCLSPGILDDPTDENEFYEEG